MRPQTTLTAALLAAIAALSLTAGPISAAQDVAVGHRSDTLGEIGVRVDRYKALDPETGVVTDVAVDEATGAIVDYGALRAQAMQAQRDRVGALDPAFEPAVRAAGAGTRLQADVLAVVGGLKNTSLQKLLARKGARVLRVDGHLATIEATAALLERLARDPRIEAIARHEGRRVTAISAATDLVEDGLFFAHALGLGTNLRIAVLEQNACVRRTHKDFSLVTWEERAGGAQCDVPSGFHSTAVAGVLASARWNNGTWQFGGLFGGRLFDGDSTFHVVNRNPNIINNSETHNPIHAREIDEAVWTKRILYLLGSANDDSGTNGKATCHSYNAICVGGYGPMSTLGPTAFADDVHADGAMWGNPVSGRERPDLVGPMGVTTASWQFDDQYDGWGGTSFATPAVTGLAALLIANHPAALDRQPTLMRALLTASAITHPVYDGDGTRLPIINDNWDDRAGAGAPRGDVADAIIEDGTYHAKHVERSADFAGGRYAQTFSIAAAAGERVRVALSWDNCPVNLTSFPNEDGLIVDLDLTVRGPNVPLHVNFVDMVATADVGAIAGSAPAPGANPSPAGGAMAGGFAVRANSVAMGSMVATTTGIAPAAPAARIRIPTVPFVASNTSHVDNYETVEFVAPVQGVYHIEVTAPRWDICPYDQGYATNLALAWSTH